MDGLTLDLKTLRPTYSGVFRNLPFLCLWMGQLLSQLADRLFMYVLLLLAYELTATNVGVSIPMLSFGIPSVLFGSLAGVFVDRWNRKRILIFSNFIRGGLVVLFIPFMHHSLVVLFALAFILYTVTQFFAPAETSSIPSLVERKDLIVANSLMMITWMGSSVIGFGLGSPLVIFWGRQMTLIVSACFYLIAGLLVSLISVRQKREKGITPRETWFELRAGFEYIRRNQIIQFAFLKMSTATAALAVISVLAISFVKQHLHMPAESFGFLVFAAGIGMLFALLALGRLSVWFRKGSLIIFGFIFSGIALFLMVLATHFLFALFFSFCLGVGNAFIMVPVQTILQERVPDPIRGRVFGVQNMIINSAFTLPVVFCGWLADLYGFSAVLILLGILLVGSGMLGLWSRHFREA